ncbi:MAG: DNA-processing protein DprA [Pseudomonadota bacterium]
MTDYRYWLALRRVPGVGAVTYRKLVEHFGNPKAIFEAEAAELRAAGVREAAVEGLAAFDAWQDVERQMELLERHQIGILTLWDETYPERLASIFDPPPVLFVRGELTVADRLAVAVVGTRLASYYGRSVCERLSGDLAARGVTVVSGLARGIDTVAHRAALDAGGRTIAVAACGLDVNYPPDNKALAERIVQGGGAAVSEMPPGTQPDRAYFPARNRIISGLSLGVAVIEAGARSGALITARCALEQGREVFAVPGSVQAAGSAGPHRLLRQGAKLVERAEDILEEVYPWAGCPRVDEAAAGFNLSGATADETAVCRIIEKGPLHIDELSRRSSLDPRALALVLLELELKGAIKQLPGKIFTR